jgi:hypothetical protein
MSNTIEAARDSYALSIAAMTIEIASLRKERDDLKIALARPAGDVEVGEMRTQLLNHVENVRHYLHLQIGKPIKPGLASAPEIALDQLRDAINHPFVRDTKP